MSKVLLQVDSLNITYSTAASLFNKEKYVALSSVSFNVLAGETIGIIGRNGCGKSSLLKALSGIISPSSGKITRFCERISLLSLALGFDPELSGEDNAILSSMLLGASRREAYRGLDSVVEFAELQNFIKKPLKTYSAGMKARLAFSVALTMKSDILLIDEVLGVGDHAFRTKAEKALIDRITSDQTVILVSHSAQQIRRLCSRVIWLENGLIKEIGAPQDIIPEFHKYIEACTGVGNKTDLSTCKP